MSALGAAARLVVRRRKETVARGGVASDRIQSRPASQGRKSLRCDPRCHHEPPDGHLTLALVFALVFTLVLGAYASWPRHADLRGFEPAEIARLETATPTASARTTRRF
jgi:hypothetical protein